MKSRVKDCEEFSSHRPTRAEGSAAGSSEEMAEIKDKLALTEIKLDDHEMKMGLIFRTRKRGGDHGDGQN
jgi:hypothetical protein